MRAKLSLAESYFLQQPVAKACGRGEEPELMLRFLCLAVLFQPPVAVTNHCNAVQIIKKLVVFKKKKRKAKQQQHYFVNITSLNPDA